ncbi:MAG: hypothetical protein GX130_09715 [Candidatus Hydrogenedens sp.]|jgi:hypothetical protein|nr:hypothetical protein [Candidatus Hydrogenedens sp.]
MIHIFSMNMLQDSVQPFLYLSGGILLALFLGFGIWSLHERFHRQKEWSVRRQLLLLGAVTVFCSLEILTLRQLMHDDVVLFIFSLLGLLVAGTALYGHLAVSLLSRLLVELILPDHPAASDRPHLAAAESLERQGNWLGALQEYFILVHMYPGHPVVLSRITHNLIHQKRYMEALHWFERLVKHATRADEATVLLKELIAVFTRNGDLSSLRNVILLFLQRFPRETEIHKELDGLEDDTAAPLLPLEGTRARKPQEGASSMMASGDGFVSGLAPLAALRSPVEELADPEEVERPVLPSLRPLEEHPLQSSEE